MFLFAVWFVLGALVGSLVGIYRCSIVGGTLSSSASNLHIGFCTGLGAIFGFVAFATLAIFYYGPLTF